MNQKHQKNIYHPNVNVTVMVKNVIQIKIGITINVHVNASLRKNNAWKDYIWNPSTCTCENGKYLESIIGDSVIKWNYRGDKNCSNKNYSNKFC